MSNKPRTEEQKMRRAYIANCKKHGATPLPIDKWRDVLKKKEAKKGEKSAKRSKPCANGKVVEIHKGDELHFMGYSPDDLAKLSRELILLAIDCALKHRCK